MALHHYDDKHHTQLCSDEMEYLNLLASNLIMHGQGALERTTYQRCSYSGCSLMQSDGNKVAHCDQALHPIIHSFD